MIGIGEGAAKVHGNRASWTRDRVSDSAHDAHD